MTKLMLIFSIIIYAVIIIPHPLFAQDTATLTVISPENAQNLQRINSLGYGKVVDAQWSAHDEYFLVGVTAGILIYDPSDWTTPPELIRSQRGRVWQLAASPTENIVATGNNDGTISLWDIVTREEIAILPGHIVN